jgi:hypothetical protein
MLIIMVLQSISLYLSYLIAIHQWPGKEKLMETKAFKSKSLGVARIMAIIFLVVLGCFLLFSPYFKEDLPDSVLYLFGALSFSAAFFHIRTLSMKTIVLRDTYWYFKATLVSKPKIIQDKFLESVSLLNFDMKAKQPGLKLNYIDNGEEFEWKMTFSVYDKASFLRYVYSVTPARVTPEAITWIENNK